MHARMTFEMFIWSKATRNRHPILKITKSQLRDWRETGELCIDLRAFFQPQIKCNLMTPPKMFIMQILSTFFSNHVFN